MSRTPWSVLQDGIDPLAYVRRASPIPGPGPQQGGCGLPSGTPTGGGETAPPTPHHRYPGPGLGATLLHTAPPPAPPKPRPGTAKMPRLPESDWWGVRPDGLTQGTAGKAVLRGVVLLPREPCRVQSVTPAPGSSSLGSIPRPYHLATSPWTLGTTSPWAISRSFSPPGGVLCTLPSRYLYAIGFLR